MSELILRQKNGSGLVWKGEKDTRVTLKERRKEERKKLV